MASQNHCLLIFSILLAVATTTAAVDEPPSTATVHPGDNTTTETRKLHHIDRYISSEALKQDSIPCSKVGSSYYNCSHRFHAADDSSSTSTAHHHRVHPRRTSPAINNISETTRKQHQQRDDRYISYEALRADNITHCGKVEQTRHKMKIHPGCSTSPSKNIKKARKLQQRDRYVVTRVPVRSLFRCMCDTMIRLMGKKD